MGHVLEKVWSPGALRLRKCVYTAGAPDPGVTRQRPELIVVFYKPSLPKQSLANWYGL